MNVKKYFAEIIGTFVLVFMGCGSAMLLGVDPAGGHLAVAFAFGLAIVAMAYAIGGVSGCHINPAVSLSMLLDKRLSGKDFIGYVISQSIGAIIAAAILFSMTQMCGMADLTGGLGSNGIGGINNAGGALVVEIILTCIFVLTILCVTANEKTSHLAGLVIGLTLVFVHIVGIPLTGTSVNPARSLGPALFAGGSALADLWIFIAGPLLGAIIAIVIYRFIVKDKA